MREVCSRSTARLLARWGLWHVGRPTCRLKVICLEEHVREYRASCVSDETKTQDGRIGVERQQSSTLHIMRIQLKKVGDSTPSLACMRADGTRTWSRLHPFFPLHDLTHYAVESVFGFGEAFFGLIASGWEIDAFAERGAGARLPVEALWAESIVGLLDLERGMNRQFTAEEFSRALEDSLNGQGIPAFRDVTDAELGRVRALRSDLEAQWSARAPGETLELTFPANRATG